ncbi:MAG: RidA family protein [Actinobacteria bacterium]|nr:RidA family protein [Actinomycetota bacterium]
MTAEEQLRERGVTLPQPPAPAAAYQLWRSGGGLFFTAGQLPLSDGALSMTGKLGSDLDIDAGADLARAAAINVLAIARAAADGDLDRVRIVKLTVYVASAPGFTDQHLVANGASQFVADVLGDDGLHARSAVGVPVLPLDSPVEVEAVFEVRAP